MKRVNLDNVLDEGCRGKRVSDELEGKRSDKQHETCDVIETKTELQA
jgi:hypothetical protein